MDLNNKAAIVTGASRGIGRAVALELARRGARVAIAARTVERRKTIPGTIGETLDAIEKAGGEAIAIRTDVKQEGDLQNLVAKTIEAFGRIDVLVNNAAYTQTTSAPVESYPLDHWRTEFASNVHGPFILMGLCVPHMRAQGAGVIINITSGVGDMAAYAPATYRPSPMGNMVGYAATKAALNRMTNALAPELAQDNIAALCVNPGFTRTEVHDALAGTYGAMGGGHRVDVPVDLIMSVITADDPRAYAGQVLHAGAGPTFQI